MSATAGHILRNRYKPWKLSVGALLLMIIGYYVPYFLFWPKIVAIGVAVLLAMGIIAVFTNTFTMAFMPWRQASRGQGIAMREGAVLITDKVKVKVRPIAYTFAGLLVFEAVVFSPWWFWLDLQLTGEACLLGQAVGMFIRWCDR